jgi:hypothetical protein
MEGIRIGLRHGDLTQLPINNAFKTSFPLPIMTIIVKLRKCKPVVMADLKNHNYVLEVS